MTAKEYLGQAYKLDERIQSQLEEVSRLRETATGLSSPTFGDRVQSSPHGDAPFVKAIERIIQFEDKINAEIDLLVALKEQIHETIETVKDPRERLVLRCRYIDGNPWKSLAVKLKIDLNTAYRLHRRALEHVALPENPIIV